MYGVDSDEATTASNDSQETDSEFEKQMELMIEQIVPDIDELY